MRERADAARLIVGISGASGVIYGIRLLKILRNLPVESHLVMTRSAEMTLAWNRRAAFAPMLRARAELPRAAAFVAVEPARKAA